MARKRRGQPVHGWVIVDKPSGVTSVQVVSAARRAFDAAKAGHGGTLDPLATGLLPVALGEATKTVAYMMDGVKVYRFTVRWGERRATDDAEGEVIATAVERPGAETIEAALPRFTGRIEQVPPAYSAVKVDGQRAYDLARADQAVDLQPRPVVIEQFRLLGCPDRDHAVFEVVSGKGAYMRSLARDLALALGTHGHVAALRRIAVGPFREADAISLDRLRALGHSPELREHLLPVEAALADIPALALTEPEACRLHRGQAVAALPIVRRLTGKFTPADAVLCTTAAGKPVALARIEGGEVRPVRVLNL